MESVRCQPNLREGTSREVPLSFLPNDFFGGAKKFEVLYDAKVHGYSTATFHQKCDNIDGTVTLVTLKNGAKFGDTIQAGGPVREERTRMLPTPFCFR